MFNPNPRRSPSKICIARCTFCVPYDGVNASCFEDDEVENTLSSGSDLNPVGSKEELMGAHREADSLHTMVHAKSHHVTHMAHNPEDTPLLSKA